MNWDQLNSTFFVVQVDAHLTKFIAELRKRQADPLSATTQTINQESQQQHSRQASLTLPLSLPDSHSQHDSNAAHSSQSEAVAESVFQGRGEDARAAASSRGDTVTCLFH